MTPFRLPRPSSPVARVLLVCLILSSLPPLPIRANDEIFPSAPAAAPTISFDGKGFIIRGKRTFIASGSIHYARIPRELWHDRLLKLKRAGFNTVQTYVFWDYHETRPAQYDFTTGSHDLAGFLQEAQDVGLYATVRLGPYDCAEWDYGGFPVWLLSNPGLRVRTDDPAFLAAVDRFWEKLIPIVAARQIHRGGNVILVQLENEDPQGDGTDLPNDYFRHLQAKAVQLGVEVPYFFSGLHHGHDPSNDVSWDVAGRNSPWISTETWIRWFNRYGNSDPDDLVTNQRHVWNLLAGCANAFNLYMFHGGTNFDFWNAYNVAASYDYGAALGQAGDLRNLYYGLRHASVFATSFPDILANCSNATDETFATGPQVMAGDSPQLTSSVIPFVRRSPAGSVEFLRNSQNEPEIATLQSGRTLLLDPMEIVPVLVDATLAPGVRAKLAAVRTFGLASQGATTTWIVYGKPNEKGHLDLDLDANAVLVGSTVPPAFQLQGANGMHPAIDLAFSEDGPAELLLRSGGRTLRILAETPAWIDRTWIVGEPGAQTVVTGPAYVGDYAETGGKAQFTIERPFGHAAPKEAVLYGAGPVARHVAVTDPAPADDEDAPVLGPWSVAKMDAPAAPDYPDSDWLTSEQPQQLGSDGDVTAYGWYRASFQELAAERAVLSGTIHSDATVFLNGNQVGPIQSSGNLTLNLQAGKNTLAIFCGFHGRLDGVGYIEKPLAELDPKGISGPITLASGEQGAAVTGWKLRGGIEPFDAADLKWTPVPSVDLKVPAYFRTTFDARPVPKDGPRPIWRLTMDGLSRGSLWFNGHNLGRYPEGLKVDGLYLPECWLKDGSNSLVIFDEEGHVPAAASVHLWCEREASREVFEVKE
jgi:beta-galactosidase